jgi:hypothetical protein
MSDSKLVVVQKTCTKVPANTVCGFIKYGDNKELCVVREVKKYKYCPKCEETIRYDDDFICTCGVPIVELYYKVKK